MNAARKRKKLLWILPVVVAIAGLGFWKMRKKPETPELAPYRVRKGKLELTIRAMGGVQPQNRLVVRPAIAGRMERVLVREGDSVSPGQILAWMSSSERAALLDAARSRGMEELKRWEDLYKATPLLAPIAGTVIARSVEPGQSVTTGDSVLVLSDRLIVKAQVDETDIGKIRLRQSCKLTLDAYPESPIPARVDHIAFEATTVNNVTVYQVDVLPERVPEFMRSGMSATVEFVSMSKKGVLLVPSEAVRSTNNRMMVLVPDPKNAEKTVPQEVQLGLSDGKKTEVLAGLKEGDTVLVSPLLLATLPDRSRELPFQMGRGGPGGGRPGGGRPGGGGGGGRSR
jgi:macrolide-specific efflux system membrane fusion protein